MKQGVRRGGLRRSALFAITLVGIVFAVPGFAQEEGAPAAASDPDPAPADDSGRADEAAPAESPKIEGAPTAVRPRKVEEIVVTARRREELLQDVPISMTVFDQKQLDARNIVNAGDLAAFTPSLSVNRNFGDDSTSFAIRGFTQELRTTPSVAVYFAEVVAPRGGGSITGGEGAGPGSFFDLENVQVLKGPQGTLFGRNTTGGAVLLVPKKPTDEWEGYFESSFGNYNMLRFQGVANAPVLDKLWLRIGFDRQTRDGYLDNTSGIGPSDLSDLGYTALRASMTFTPWESVENYSIFTYLDSHNNGGINQLFACSENPTLAVYLPFCEDQLARQGGDFYEVKSLFPNPRSTIEQWQFINTTTWEATDYFTIKNIIATADLETSLNVAQFGTDFQVPTPSGSLPFFFSTAGTEKGIPTNSQDSFVEELRFQANAFDERLQWQGGFYYENSDPDGLSGSVSANSISCDLSTLGGGNPADYRCNDILGFFLQNVSRSFGTISYENKALYTQASLDLLPDHPDLLSLTGGVRYTWDKTRGTSIQTAYSFDQLPQGGFGPPTGAKCVAGAATFPECTIGLAQDSDAPTWLIDLDLKPIDETLLYVKWARGYRQGSVNIFGLEGLNTYGPEKVDTYELGAKTSFEYPIPGTFNVAGFYNDFRDQQIQLGVLPVQFVPTTAIVNAGSSRIWGVEAELNTEPIENVRLGVGYTYLNTKIEELNFPEDVPGALILVPSAAEGDRLPFTPDHKLSASASYLLPFVPQRAGDVTVSANFVFTSDQQAVTAAASAFHTIPSYELLNLDLTWSQVMDTPVDASIFATNVLDEHYWTFVSGTFNATGFETRSLGQPTMFGARLRYNFSL
jgi:iron complex outermembrane receptor protein